LEYKRTLLILNNPSRFLPKPFMYFCYSQFHSHLPEELFFDDFTNFFRKANNQTAK